MDMDAGSITSKSKINLKKELLAHFGFDNFKGDQEKIIKSILAGKDTFVFDAKLGERYGRDSVVIYPPVDTDFYTPAAVPREELRELMEDLLRDDRLKIDMARLLTLKAAWLMDVAGNKVAKTEIAMIKVVAPSMACQVIDWAMQVHGGGGMCDDFPLAYAYAGARTLRFADGPDEVHRNAIAKWELGKYGSYGRDAAVPVTRGS